MMMPDYPPSVVAAVAVAIHRAACPLRDDPDHDCARDAANEELFIPRARAALDRAAPMLADEIARKILAHADDRWPSGCIGSQPARRHFRTAAQIAGLAF